MFSKSKHYCLYVVIFIIRLTTYFGPCAGPSSGHKMYKEEKTVQCESKNMVYKLKFNEILLSFHIQKYSCLIKMNIT
jgi:hypothetical protein